MNKNEGTDTLIKELEETGQIEILSDEETREYEEIVAKHGNSVSEFVKECRERGYSEFVIGAIVGRYYTLQEKKNIVRKGWRRFVPEILKK